MEPATADGGLGLALLRPVRLGNAFEEAVERILEAIKLGAFTAGDRLPPERELAAHLNISRETLREAIKALQQSGYVETKRGRFGGTFVTYQPREPTPGDLNRAAAGLGEELEDALTFRYAVEIGAAEAAARNSLTREQRERLNRRLADVQQAGLPDYRQADSRFHITVAELAGSRMLTATVIEARGLLNDLLNAIPMLRHNIAHTGEQHAGIARAVLAGDPEAARRAAQEHLDGTAALLRGFLR